MATLCSSSQDPRIQGQKKNRTPQVRSFSRTNSRPAPWAYTDGYQEKEVSRPWSGHLSPIHAVASGQSAPRSVGSSSTVPLSRGHRSQVERPGVTLA